MIIQIQTKLLEMIENWKMFASSTTGSQINARMPFQCHIKNVQLCDKKNTEQEVSKFLFNETEHFPQVEKCLRRRRDKQQTKTASQMFSSWIDSDRYYESNSKTHFNAVEELQELNQKLLKIFKDM